MKTIEKVETEFSIITLCYNLKRVMNILGKEGLKKALKSVYKGNLFQTAIITTHPVVEDYWQPYKLGSITEINVN